MMRAEREGSTMASAERKYWVKMNYRFNLDSMHNHVWCLIYDIEDGLYDSVELLGERMDVDRLYEFKEELEDLMSKAFGKVTGKEYGRIKAISDERNMIRYATCLNNGMSERDAGYAFFD